MPSRKPQGCTFWPPYFLLFLGLAGAFFFAGVSDFAALADLAPPAAAFAAFGAAVAVPPFAAGAAPWAAGTASDATWISTWLVRFLIGVPRPMAAMVNRLSVWPSLITAYFTRRRSASNASFLRNAFCSALATADSSTFWICFAALFFQNFQITYASGTARPRIRSITNRIFRADCRADR